MPRAAQLDVTAVTDVRVKRYWLVVLLAYCRVPVTWRWLWDRAAVADVAEDL